MAQNGLARKQAGNAYQSYRNTRLTQRQQQTTTNVQKKMFPHLEVVLCSVLSVMVFALALGVVFFKISLTSAQQTLQNTETQTARLTNYNSGMGQQLDEMQSSSRLNQIAKTSGLSLKNNQVRNITR